MSLALLMSACDEEEVKIEEIEKPVITPNIDPDPEHDLYITYDESIEGVWTPKYVDPSGKVTLLGDGKRSAQTTDMYVDEDRNVIIVGTATDSERMSYPVIWKNSEPTLLTDTTLHRYASAQGMRIHGDDLYVVGFEFGINYPAACYWKNGKKVSLSNGETSGVATDIWIDGEDVYVAGSIKNAAGNPEAYYWKNGVIKKIPGTYASGILVKDNSLYITGDLGVAKYWKDGNLVSVTGSKNTGVDIAPKRMKIFGSDLYMIGIGEYWKNGEVVTIGNGAKDVHATYDFAVQGDDVYMAGFRHPREIYEPTYWKNGVPVSVTDGKFNGGVSAIVAKPKTK
ncbi:hypothetical protein DQQ10_12120 [Pseudochryseolinea flava]|uniref:Uncharacterized protein n=2 Tax=Pseudochryseolinea flava TaxID=2059302 RepID=A0A364Y2Q4_9BACT|nr:hypothetical protein DQQ10_12120 [Pseudochryseolinea flava]